jgi:sigma-B regulation protein RsbU (phosphoserine phosphatase)
VVADVSGKGIPAALIMATFRALLRSHAHAGLEPAPLLSAVSHQLYDCTGLETFATAFYGELDPASGRFTYSCAGHNPPLWIGTGGIVRRLEEGGGIMGIAEETPFQSGEITLAPGTG